MGRGWGKIKLQIVFEIKAKKGLKKGKQKKSTWDGIGIKKKNPINAPSIHIGAQVGVGSLWFDINTTYLNFTFFIMCVFC